MNWDNVDDRRLILRGPNIVAAHLGLEQLRERVPIVVFDGTPQRPQVEEFFKGFFDVYGVPSVVPPELSV